MVKTSDISGFLSAALQIFALPSCCTEQIWLLSTFWHSVSFQLLTVKMSKKNEDVLHMQTLEDRTAVLVPYRRQLTNCDPQQPRSGDLTF